MKKRISTLEKMTIKQLAKHIEDITQTEVCKDTKYCSVLMKVFLSKSERVLESQKNNGQDPF